jgi:hypothetical protein
MSVSPTPVPLLDKPDGLLCNDFVTHGIVDLRLVLLGRERDLIQGPLSLILQIRAPDDSRN